LSIATVGPGLVDGVWSEVLTVMVDRQGRGTGTGGPPDAWEGRGDETVRTGRPC
jgi:hypothetical protein